MLQSSITLITVLFVQVYSAPQFITFSEGKLGVNFGGYHAGVGLGGQGGNGRSAGGLYAEAGTPFGPAAKAGLGGAVDGGGGTAGGLYAGATAGGNVNAAAGLGGAVGAGKAVGGGYSSAQAGHHSSSSVLGGESDASGSSGFSISAHKSIGIPTTVVKETEYSVVPVKEVKTTHKKVYSEANFETANEITPVAKAGVESNVHIDVEANAPTSGFVKEVSKWQGPHYRTNNIPPVNFHHKMRSFFKIPQRRYSPQTWKIPQQYNYIHQVNVAPTPAEVIVHKHKPHHHGNVHKTVYLGGYVGAGGEVGTPVVNSSPIEKRIDIETEGGAGATINGQHYGSGKTVTYSKEVVVSNKPNTFFQDIFNIPISALKAVSGFLSNTAGSTSVSVQKAASVQADSDSITSKHVPSSSSSSEAHISVQTPSASKFIDDIFSIPINTLSAVNTFLDNNVAGRKRVQVTAETEGEPTRIRLGPYARRRANKRVVIVQEPINQQSAPQGSD